MNVDIYRNCRVSPHCHHHSVWFCALLRTATCGKARIFKVRGLHLPKDLAYY